MKEITAEEAEIIIGRMIKDTQKNKEATNKVVEKIMERRRIKIIQRILILIGILVGWLIWTFPNQNQIKKDIVHAGHEETSKLPTDLGKAIGEMATRREREQKEKEQKEAKATAAPEATVELESGSIRYARAKGSVKVYAEPTTELKAMYSCRKGANILVSGNGEWLILLGEKGKKIGYVRSSKVEETKAKATAAPEAKATVAPEAETTVAPEAETTVAPEAEATVVPEAETTVAPVATKKPATATKKKKVARVTNATWVNLRTGPMKAIKKTLKRGTKVIIKKKSGNWFKIKVQKTGDTGWMYGKYLKRINRNDRNSSKANSSRKSFQGIKLQYAKAYKITSDALTPLMGTKIFNGHIETWYSEAKKPGRGLKIPGRHSTTEDGTVRDKDGYICVAANENQIKKGTILMTSLGPAKVYDCGCGPNVIDIYVNEEWQYNRTAMTQKIKKISAK